MKAAVLAPGGDYAIENRPIPSPEAGEILVAPRAVGICGSDLHYYQDGRIGDWQILRPHVLGHEFAGVVEQVGLGVENVAVGERVAVEPIIPCGLCGACKDDLYNLCADFRFTGSPHTDGALQEYVAVPAQAAHRLPLNMPFRLGALVEPTSIAVHAVRRSRLRPGDNALVIGAGPIGLLIASCALAYGADAVYIADINQARLETAARLGALPLHVDGVGDAAQALTSARPEGVEIAFEAVGKAATLELALQAVRPAGRVVAVGVNPDSHIAFPLMLAQSKEADLVPVYLGRNAFPESIELLATGKIDGQALLGDPFSLEETPEAMEAATAGSGPIKVMISPNREVL